MLKFNASSYTIMFRCTSRILWQLNASLATTATETKPQPINNNVKIDARLKENTSHITTMKEFNSLKKELCSNLNVTSLVTSKINTAENLETLLKVITPLLSKADILQAMTIISMWANKNNKSTPHTVADNKSTRSMNNISAKDKYTSKPDENNFSSYAMLSTSEMIKEIKKLTTESNRNVPLLRYLYNQIFLYNERLHVGACSSLIYCMSRLNYSDERLLGKIWKDTVHHLDTCPQTIAPSLVVSIVRSMSVIRYQNSFLLNDFCLQVIRHKTLYNSTHVANLLSSFALLGYHSTHVDELIKLYLPQMKIDELEPVVWLNLVWALTAFNKANESHVESVLDNMFLQTLMLPGSIEKSSHILKVLNINGYAQFVLKKYPAPSFVESKVVPYIVCNRSKQKEMYVDALEGTLKQVFPSESHYQMNVNSEMGFLIDAVVNVDVNCTPVPQEESTNKKSLQIAVLITDYHDYCVGSQDYTGLIKIYMNLLRHKNYEILCIPYQNFGLEDKVEKRAAYIKEQLLKKYKVLL